MRAFVTGATGFLGSHVIDRLIAQDWEVAALVRRNVATSEPLPYYPILGSLESLDSIRDQIVDFRPSVVIHLAWTGVGSSERDDPKQIDTNLTGTLALFRAAAEAGCRAFLGLGSQAEYGPCDEVIVEDRPLAPVTLYGAAKASAGLLLGRLAALSDIRLVWLRLFSCYGPKDRCNALVPDLIQRFLSEKSASITNWDRPWDYLHVTDAAEAIERCARSEHANGVYNLASGRSVPLRIIAEQLREIVGSQSPIDHVVSTMPLPSLRASVARLSEHTGWSPRIELAVGLNSTVDWMREKSGFGLLPVVMGGHSA